jgi:ABC-2 type transport system ATP-binding protein
MKQKLGILRAMIHSPSVLFLDEPTAGLDPIAQGNVREMIEGISEMNTTVFMTTHNLPEAERIADKIGVINEGQLVTVGSASDLRSQVGRSNRMVIKSLSKATDFSHIVAEIKGVIVVRTVEEEYSLEIEVENYAKTAPVIINNLAQEGVTILEAKLQQQSLEDIYYQIMNYSPNGEKTSAA